MEGLTMKKFVLGLVIACTLLTFTQMVAQETSLPTFKTYALLVGVKDYEHHDKLVNPVPDVKAIEEELREVYKCETKMLLNPSRRQFLIALHELAKRRYGSNDQLLLFFSGHGWYDETIKRGYLALKDSKQVQNDQIYDSYVPHEDVRTILERLDCKHVLLIVDSCFSGTLDPTIAMVNKGKATNAPYASVPRSEYIKRKLKYKTRRYITAGGKEYVPDGRPGHHSPFARRILESLRTFGGNDAILTLEEMMLEIEKAQPEPRTGELLGNEPGSSFVLIASPEIEPPKPKPKYGELIVLVTPKEAQVTVRPLDNPQRAVKPKPRGNSFRLPVGRYRVRASLTGYETKTQDVYVGEGKRAIRLTLPRDIIREFTSKKDGAEMVLIPAGEFQMGTDPAEIPQLVQLYKEYGAKASWFEDETPRHTVNLDAFYMDKYEVTNSQYAQFLNDYGKNADAVGHELIDLDDEDCLIEKGGSVYRPKSGYENHPVIEVTWYGAAAYAQFYGKRLPTEAEWEKAARGGLVGKKYPWGDSISPTKANYDSDRSRSYSTADMLEYLNPVGSFPPNGYGLYDMAGNVWEWCADEYDKNYYSKSPKDNPTGPGTPILFVNSGFTSVKESRVCRGGSWYNGPNDVRCAIRYRIYPSFCYNDQGFRCVVSSPSIPQ